MLERVLKYSARHVDVLRKGRFAKTVDFQGIRVRIDRPAGHVQSGKDAEGNAWSRTYHVDYGYIPRTRGGDGDGLDVYLGAETKSPVAYWVQQLKQDGSFDEYKLMLGFRDMRSAKAMWLAHTPRKFFGSITSTSVGLVRALLGIEGDVAKCILAKAVEPGETARLLLEVGPPNEWSGAVAGFLGKERCAKIKALWDALDDQRKAIVQDAFDRNFWETEDVVDEAPIVADLTETYPELAKRSIAKAVNVDTEQRYVLGIMLVPEEIDLQGDIYSAEEVEKAAHNYLRFFRNTGLQHQQLANHLVSVVESYIARADYEINGVAIKAGTWLMAVIVHDDEVWEMVKSGAFTGFSIGGTAIKTDPVTGQPMKPPPAEARFAPE